MNFNPAEPNSTRTITLTYSTDTDGNMEINVDAEGFEDKPEAIHLFLEATLEVLKGDN